MNRLREYRLDADLTQRELAEHAGVAEEVISRIETGRSWPRDLTQARIARALGKDRADIWPERVAS